MQIFVVLKHVVRIGTLDFEVNVMTTCLQILSNSFYIIQPSY
jgi:hypothetical protein